MDIWGDIPSWIIAIATPISILVGFHYAKKQLMHTKKIEEQRFLFELDKLFMSNEHREISRNIYNEIYRSQPFHIDEDMRGKLSNYLSDLEYLCNLYEEDIVTKDQLESLEGMQIIEAFRSDAVKSFIEEERITTNEPDLWSTAEKVAKELDKTS
ncbi:MAG TPA: hypothetical protein VNK44_00695 [Candidatus Nitrosotenuis sp.]|nr:hypothetical protein [Candidatus Nitrosotenuis sp.]